jgi:hypothetical protein
MTEISTQQIWTVSGVTIQKKLDTATRAALISIGAFFCNADKLHFMHYF